MERIYLASETNLTLQENRMFDLVHLAQEDSQQLEGAAIATHTNFLSAQQEQEGMALPRERILSTTRLRQLVDKDEDALGIISKNINQIN